MENGLSGFFFNVINGVMIVALGMNPVLLGLILGVKTLWDGAIDPFIAQWSDKTRSRWGRRRPFILVGGIGRLLLLVAIFALFPRDGSIKSNADFAAEKAAHEEKAAQAAADLPAREPPPFAGQLTSESPVTPDGELTAPVKEPAPAPAAPILKKKPRPGMIESIRNGFAAFMADDNSYHRKVTVYLLVACLLFSGFGSLNQTPYYALGIELCPSYDGRTRVVTYRSFFGKLIGLVSPWILPFAFLPIFANVIDGLTWYAVGACLIGLPIVVLMVRNTHERRIVTSAKSRGPNLLQAIWFTARNIHFLKILFLYTFIGLVNGLFTQFGLFLTIYWVFKGDALSATVLGGYASTLALLLSFISLPLINWACRKLQKHRALRFALIWMSIGTALKWILINPEHPYWQLALPFFFSIGISSVYTILPTLMADVTDIDELENGTRREGMFGAVMSFLTNLLGTLGPVASGVVLVLSGFDATLGADQTPETIINMRLMFSIVPASLLLLGLVALWRYPLTRDYMTQVKETLKVRRAQAAAALAAEPQS